MTETTPATEPMTETTPTTGPSPQTESAPTETPPLTETSAVAEAKTDDAEAIAALQALGPRSFARMCRQIPMRTFLMELEKIDRGVYYRHFKGYRPQKIDAAHLDKVLKKELFERRNGMLAQLVIYNWDEAEWQLYAALQKEVKKINEDVEAIQTITDAEGDAICGALEAEFDKRDVYIATVINGVRVSKDYLQKRFGDVMA